MMDTRLAPNFEDMSDDTIPKSSSDPSTENSADTNPNPMPQTQQTPHQQQQQQAITLSFEQIQLLIQSAVSSKPQQVAEMSLKEKDNPFYAAANKITKLKSHDLNQIPGILTTYGGRAAECSPLFMDLVKVAYITSKYPPKAEEIRTYIIELLRELGSKDKNVLSKNTDALACSIWSYRCHMDAAGSALQARQKKNPKQRLASNEKENAGNKQSNTRPPLA